MRQTRMELNESAIEIMPSTRRKSNGSAARGMHATVKKKYGGQEITKNVMPTVSLGSTRRFSLNIISKTAPALEPILRLGIRQIGNARLRYRPSAQKNGAARIQTGAGFITTRAVLKIWPVGVRTPTTTLKRFLICKAADALIVKSSWRTRNFMWTTFILCQRAVQTLAKTYRFYARSAIYGNTITTRLITPDHWECSFEAIGVKQ